MLVLTLKVGEPLYIGDDIAIVVSDVGTGKRTVRVTISSPKSVQFIRDSLLPHDDPRRLLLPKENGSADDHVPHGTGAANDGRTRGQPR